MHSFHSQPPRRIDVVLIRVSDVEYLMRPEAKLACPCHEDPGVRLFVAKVGRKYHEPEIAVKA